MLFNYYQKGHEQGFKDGFEKQVKDYSGFPKIVGLLSDNALQTYIDGYNSGYKQGERKYSYEKQENYRENDSIEDSLPKSYDESLRNIEDNRESINEDELPIAPLPEKEVLESDQSKDLGNSGDGSPEKEESVDGVSEKEIEKYERETKLAFHYNQGLMHGRTDGECNEEKSYSNDEDSEFRSVYNKAYDLAYAKGKQKYDNSLMPGVDLS